MIRNHIGIIATAECVLINSTIFLFYIPRINVASFWNSVAPKFNVKLRLDLYMRESKNVFWFYSFYLQD